MKAKGFWRGLVFGLMPHTFCILFVIFTLIGSVVGATIARRFLLIPHFVLFLVILSLIFATISAWFYLRSHCCCSSKGIKKNWRYLVILYGTTLAVNAVFIYYIFPAVTASTANIGNNQAVVSQATATMTIKVAIPCSGHASLIISELKQARGVGNVSYVPLDTFTVNYDPAVTNEASILGLEIFKTYPATKI